MVVDVLKKLKKDAKVRQRQGTNEKAKAQVTVQQTKQKPPEPAHKYFVSNNWKSLLERKPDIAPKAKERSSTGGGSLLGQTQTAGSAGKNVVALDCEMVGVGPGGERSVLARVSIVDFEGKVLMDRFVRPKEFVTDFRTAITGITAGTFKRPDVISEDIARKMAADLLDGKIVVGHSVQFDFQALLLSHPHVLIRDTALFRPLRPPGQKRTPALKKLCQHWLQEKIQEGEHDSVQDARIALRLYRLKSKEWEKQLRSAMQHHSLGGSAAGRAVGEEFLGFDGDGDDDEGERVDRSQAVKSGSNKKGVKKKVKSKAPAASAGDAPRPSASSTGELSRKKKKKQIRPP
eukprot:TRINITY_DN11855_c3_g1_i1.p1 TRINITY_DN11855_c3_g1~~TRINITY_DN11855_c3_g1_i1.p1  ORF type:complete len:346 (+),score=86.29 TRINITY_DN11855_c3_g1_i1:62-1099(+)